MRAHARHSKRLVNAAAPAWLCLAIGSSATSSCTLLADDFEPQPYSETTEHDAAVADPNDASSPSRRELPDCEGLPEERCAAARRGGSAAPARPEDAAPETPRPSGAVSPEILVRSRELLGAGAHHGLERRRSRFWSSAIAGRPHRRACRRRPLAGP
jgi:hypothetical protein